MALSQDNYAKAQNNVDIKHPTYWVYYIIIYVYILSPQTSFLHIFLSYTNTMLKLSWLALHHCFHGYITTQGLALAIEQDILQK